MDDVTIFIIGAKGQLGTALKKKYPHARSADIEELNITDKKSVEAFDWSGIQTIVNAAAYTNVDGAETAKGRVTAWQVNALAVNNLQQLATKNNMTLVHISTDYVFDGTKNPHTEDEPFSPLNAYGASKAAGDIVVSLTPKHYILRSSWVIGEGKNFVRTMLDLGKKGFNPRVVADQVGRLTFTSELVGVINHLLINQCDFGTYNVSNGGEQVSWADVTREIYKHIEIKNKVTDITTAEYYKNKPEAAIRPLNSMLDLSKLKATGFTSKDWRSDLESYISKEMQK